MKPHAAVVIVALMTPSGILAQGTFLYDQQSSTDEGHLLYGSGPTMQNIPTPWGQSFTPNFSGISFIRLKFDDGNTNDGLGATIHLNLRSGSITGPLLGTTAPVTMPNLFTGTANFFFATEISVTPGVMYYFEPIVESGGPWNLDAESFNYSGGYVIYGGTPLTGSDLWFREGLYVIPEPCATGLGLIALTVLAARRRWLRLPH